MNNTLYTQLAPLGFAEWLENNDFAGVIDDLEFTDTATIDSVERTGLNALAFRWLREEKKLECNVSELTSSKYRCSIWHNKRFVYSCESFHSWEEAEHHALCKALEILSKGGENG